MRTMILMVVMLMAMASTAAAGPLVLSNIGGGWQNPAPPENPPGLYIDNAGGSLTDSIYWGCCGISKSSYDFDPVDGATNPVYSTPFLLGTFTHNNVQINPPYLQTVDYELSFDTNGVPSPLGFVTSFTHQETSNAAPCPDGPEGPSTSVCDDIVTLSNLAFDTLINVGGDLYYFTILGFSKDGGNTFSNGFQSPEFASSSAGLYAEVTALPSQVPEPTSLLLLGSGLACAAVIVRRRKARA